MNRLTLIALLNLLSVSTLFGQGFPGETPNLLLNKTVKPRVISELFQKYAYKNFFWEFDKEKEQFTKDQKENKPFPSGPSYSLVSDYNKLVGQEFKVIAIYDIIPKYAFSSKEYAIQLENSEIGTVYYKYDPKYEHDFELEVVGGLDYPEGYFCKEIQHKIDKFENKETFYSPTKDGINFVKVVENGKVYIYLSVQISGSTLNVRERGLFILFSDGTKITKPSAEIDVKAGGGSGYVYSAFISLAEAEIKLLTSKTITDIKLYIYEGSVDDESGMKIKEYLKCLTK